MPSETSDASRGFPIESSFLRSDPRATLFDILGYGLSWVEVLLLAAATKPVELERGSTASQAAIGLPQWLMDPNTISWPNRIDAQAVSAGKVVHLRHGNVNSTPEK